MVTSPQKRLWTVDHAPNCPRCTSVARPRGTMEQRLALRLILPPSTAPNSSAEVRRSPAYGKFAEEPTRPELERFFYLDDVDRALIGKRRGDQNRLGFALQMCTVRYVGLFLEDPLVVPWPVIEHLGQELGIEDISCVKRYTERLKTAYEHAWEIRDAYGYHQYEDPEWGRLFRTVPARPGVDERRGAAG